MHNSAERETHQADYSASSVATNIGDGTADGDQVRKPASSTGQDVRSNGQSVPDAVVGFIERNPVIAAGAALAVGAAVVMAVQSRRSAANRIDRRIQRAVRSMDQTFSREMKALRRSDTADRLGQFGSTIGDAFSRIDLTPLAERGREYLDQARRRFGA